MLLPAAPRPPPVAWPVTAAPRRPPTAAAAAAPTGRLCRGPPLGGRRLPSSGATAATAAAAAAAGRHPAGGRRVGVGGSSVAATAPRASSAAPPPAAGGGPAADAVAPVADAAAAMAPTPDGDANGGGGGVGGGDGPGAPPPGAAALSVRGRALLSPFPEYLRLAFAAADDPYDADTNPGGYISLSVAENRLSADLIAAHLSRRPPLPAAALAYGPMCGTPGLRAALAALFSASLAAGKRVFPPEAVHLSSGAGAVIDLLASVVADAGDGVLVPTPLYYGFVRDFASRAGVATVAAPMDPAAGFAITAAGLDAAWRANAARVTPVNLRAVVVCNPGNPTGAIMPAAEVAAVVRWGRSKGIHLIFDEIYVHSTFDPPPLGGGKAPFVSVAEVLADAGEEGLGDDVHIVWSFSKDFCGNALRAGVLLTDNAAVREVFATVTYFSSVAVDTQAALTALLTDRPALDAYLAENRRRLSSAAAAAADAMASARPAGATITAVPPAAGFFLWTDLRPLLAAVSAAEVEAAAAARGVPLTGGPADAFAREDAVFRRLVRAKVLVTPGGQCYCEQAGWFRFCFASASEAEVRVAWARIEDAFRPEPVYP